MPVKIYIDQGHNPVNPNAGAEGNGYREQDIVYRVGNCSSLKTVELPDQLWFLQDGAFMGCTSLESITIPNYCLNIRGTVFEEQVQIYYDGTVSECAQESYGWQMFKENCESGFYIICSDGKYWHQSNK